MARALKGSEPSGDDIMRFMIESARSCAGMSAGEYSGHLEGVRRAQRQMELACGDEVVEGQLAGRLYDQDEPWNSPVLLYFHAAGLVVCMRTFALVEPGDCLVHLAEVIDD